jgi:hypothetical protein
LYQLSGSALSSSRNFVVSMRKNLSSRCQVSGVRYQLTALSDAVLAGDHGRNDERK